MQDSSRNEKRNQQLCCEITKQKSARRNAILDFGRFACNLHVAIRCWTMRTQFVALKQRIKTSGGAIRLDPRLVSARIKARNAARRQPFRSSFAFQLVLLLRLWLVCMQPLRCRDATMMLASAHFWGHCGQNDDRNASFHYRFIDVKAERKGSFASASCNAVWLRW